MSLLNQELPPPNLQEAMLARESGQTLARFVRVEHSLTLRVADTEPEASIELPASVVSLLMRILEAMAAHEGIALVPRDAELSTAQAADILKVSRPYLVKLLDEGVIPCRKVGTHRRVRVMDVISYKEKSNRRRKRALEKLTRESQEQGTGYFGE